MAQTAKLYRTGLMQFNRNYRLNKYGHPNNNEEIVDIEQSYAQYGKHKHKEYNSSPPEIERYRTLGSVGNLHVKKEPSRILLSKAEEIKQDKMIDNEDGIQKRGFHKLDEEEKKEVAQETKEDVAVNPDKFGQGGIPNEIDGGADHTSKGGHFKAGIKGIKAVELEEKKPEVAQPKNKKARDDGDDVKAEEEYGDKKLMPPGDREDRLDDTRMGRLSERPEGQKELQKSFWV